MILDLLRLAVLFSGLTISSIQDWKTREIDDKIWVCMGIAGGMLTAADLAFQWSTPKLLLTAISIALAFIIGFSIYYLGLFGGADAKALLCIAAVTPYPPKLVEPILPSINPFFPITVFCNGLLLSLLI
ncbi:MAG TPA: prepilin peptidase, partial [Candidatus Methanomethylia archaeon]|nr:prepilin peptidase [Candidatus Methanomethylicia archaeon]